MTTPLILALVGLGIGSAGAVLAFLAGHGASRRTARPDLSQAMRRSLVPCRHGPGRLALIAVVFLVVAGSAAWGVQRGLSYCGEGIQRADGECVGTTDGSYVFDATLAGVETLIQQENERVAAAGRPFVTVAYLAPLSRGVGGAQQLASVLHGLEGAYLAQIQANEPVGTHDPLIRLVLANDGSGQQSWAPIVRQLAGMTGGPDRLVSVIGSGNDLAAVAATRALSAAGIPVISTTVQPTMTGDLRLPGVFTVAPTISAEATALAETASRADAHDRRAMLVTSAAPGDLYDRTLAAALRLEIPAAGLSVSAGQEFAPGPAEAASFSELAPDICSAAISSVFFAGSAADLAGLLHALALRPCTGLRLRVFAGSGALAAAPQADGSAGAGITVYYATPASPAQWSTPVTGPQAAAAAAFKGFAAAFGSRFGASGLADGQAMLTHDALLTAAAASRLAAAQGGTSDVMQALPELNGPFAVVGVTGIISLTGGIGAAGKPVAVIRVAPGQSGALAYLLTGPA
jgi:ABC-type branched-subunit amino acid transport system substrate-binding protein